MKTAGVISSAIAGAALLASSVNAATGAAFTVDPLVIKGKHFFYKTNGSEFFIRGVAYQQDYTATPGDTDAATSYTDPLANFTDCSRDIPYLQMLNTNVIRTYAVDPTQNHTACMNALAAAGIYVVSDLSDPTNSINRDDPQWTTTLYARYTALVDNLAQYNNVLGFFAGNEVSNNVNVTGASAYVKAAVRDTKAYIAAKGYRTMGVGYATYDGPIRDDLAQYFNCGNTTDAIDFFGYNIYSWCGDSTYAATYEGDTEFFSSYSVPAFFAEYGCNTVEPRTFTEVQALYGPNMTAVWAGGIVYEYFQSTNNYGLVSILPDNSVSTLTDFNYYSSQINNISPSSTAASAYSPSLTATTCPSVGPSWSAVASPLPPSPNVNLCNCASQAATCVVKNSTAETSYGDIFNYICSNDAAACAGIANNATTGTFGAYEPCPAEQQLNYVLNQYYIGQKSVSSACSFSGLAQPTAASSASTCSALIAAASTGSVSAAASATGSGSGSSSSSSATSSKSAATGLSAPILGFGLLHMGLYVFGAALTGAGMILL